MDGQLIAQLLVEFIGTFLFITVILVATSKAVVGPASSYIAPFAIAFALLVMIFFAGQISGGHVNPAVTTSKMLQGEVSVSSGIGYIIVQLMAAAAAFLFYKNIHEKYTLK